MRRAHWAVGLVLSVCIVPSRSFPCSIVQIGFLPVGSPWGGLAEQPRASKVPARPFVFIQTGYQLPQDIYLGLERVALEFVQVKLDPIFDRVPGLAVFQATADLTPAVYCNYPKSFDCAEVESSFDSRELTAEVGFRAVAERTYGDSGCGGGYDCGGRTPPYASINVTIADDEAARLAGWLVEYSATTDYVAASVVLATDFGGGAFQLVSRDAPMNFGRWKQICIQMRPVLWDATVGTPRDLGCAAFE